MTVSVFYCQGLTVFHRKIYRHFFTVKNFTVINTVELFLLERKKDIHTVQDYIFGPLCTLHYSSDTCIRCFYMPAYLSFQLACCLLSQKTKYSCFWINQDDNYMEKHITRILWNHYRSISLRVNTLSGLEPPFKHCNEHWVRGSLF